LSADFYLKTRTLGLGFLGFVIGFVFNDSLADEDIG
jgi:small-conductance mechanosensitive channel